VTALRALLAVLMMLGVAAPTAAARVPDAPPIARAASVCADYPNQAAAQRAADTSDADHDGIYCVISPW
jgi:hypothetical protein